jgi:N-acetylglucosamine kinase-like BadF-type ATPase
VSNAILSVFPGVSVETFHDLHGAVVSLLGDKKGIACILGTGSNSCLWDGNKIIQNVKSLGYLLGDEGSGTYIGKMFVRDILIGDADQEIAKIFYTKNNLNFSKTLDRVYKEPNPNLFFAHQMKLLRELIEVPYCQNIVSRAFEDFVKVQLIRYPGYDVLPVSFVGSIATNFKDILEEVLSNHNIRLGKIMKEPMAGMIEHHLR